MTRGRYTKLRLRLTLTRVLLGLGARLLHCAYAPPRTRPSWSMKGAMLGAAFWYEYPKLLSPSVAVSLSAAVWSMPHCRVLWFFSINYLRKKKIM